jgi:hypothetical protein
MRQERVDAIDHLVAPEHDRCRARLLKCAMQRKALQPVRMGDPREDDMGDPRIDKVEVREVFDCNGLES